MFNNLLHASIAVMKRLFKTGAGCFVLLLAVSGCSQLRLDTGDSLSALNIDEVARIQAATCTETVIEYGTGTRLADSYTRSVPGTGPTVGSGNQAAPIREDLSASERQAVEFALTGQEATGNAWFYMDPDEDVPENPISYEVPTNAPELANLLAKCAKQEFMAAREVSDGDLAELLASLALAQEYSATEISTAVNSQLQAGETLPLAPMKLTYSGDTGQYEYVPDNTANPEINSTVNTTPTAAATSRPDPERLSASLTAIDRLRYHLELFGGRDKSMPDETLYNWATALHRQEAQLLASGARDTREHSYVLATGNEQLADSARAALAGEVSIIASKPSSGKNAGENLDVEMARANARLIMQITSHFGAQIEPLPGLDVSMTDTRSDD